MYETVEFAFHKVTFSNIIIVQVIHIIPDKKLSFLFEINSVIEQALDYIFLQDRDGLTVIPGIKLLKHSQCVNM